MRRRANELEALFSTARELVRLQDVDEVLGRLVERAHQLMGTDVTYLSEVENAGGDLRVRHSVGTVTPGMRCVAIRWAAQPSNSIRRAASAAEGADEGAEAACATPHNSASAPAKQVLLCIVMIPW